MEGLSGQRLLVTGGSGFIGTAVVRMLLAAGADVTVADLRPFPDAEVPAVIGDLCDPENQRRAVTPDVTGVVHLAAMTSVLRSRHEPAEVYRTNVAMTAGLLERVRELAVDRFVFASTNAVVGDVGAAVIHEDLPLRPLTPYGGTKAAGEMLLSAYAASYGIRACTLRLTNVYGPGMQRKDSFVPRLMRAALSDDPVEIYGEGRQRRDFVHVDDVCQAVLLALGGRVTGPLVVGSGRSVSVLELVDLARRATGGALPARHVALKPGEMPAVVVSIDRARTLGFAPTVALPEGLASVWRDFRAAATAGRA